MITQNRTSGAQSSLQSADGQLLVRNTGQLTAARRWLSSDGTPTGVTQMARTHPAPVDYWVGPPAGERWGIGMIQITISDNASFGQTDFGGIAAGLTNGCQLLYTSTATGVVDLYGLPVKRNYEWLHLPAGVELTTFAGTAQTLSVQFNSYIQSGQYLILDGDLGERLMLRARDDLSSLVSMTGQARVVILPK